MSDEPIDIEADIFATAFNAVIYLKGGMFGLIIALGSPTNASK